MVGSQKRQIVWDIPATLELKEAFEWLRKQSPTSAKRLKQEIHLTLERISINPDVFPVDRFKQNNSGNYRAFEFWSYRITYKYSDQQIQVLRVRHTSQLPKEH